MSAQELSQKMEYSLQNFADKYSMSLLEISVGIIYFVFGLLKLFPGLSPAEQLAGDTLSIVTFALVPKYILLWILGSWEMYIGIFLIFRIKSNVVIWLLLVHLIGTLLPIVFFPDQVFTFFPFSITIVGQYIMKNIVLVSAALVIYASRKRQ